MPTVTILSEAELRRLLPLDLAAVACVEAAFAALATGAVVMPPILSMAIAEHNGEIDVKTAYVPGLDSFAVKMSPGFFDNPKLGLPSTSGLMTLFSARTGALEALLLDNGYLTDVRTAAAGAVAAKHLARADARRALVLGAGMQARLQLTALTLVRPIERAEAWARDADAAARFAQEMSAALALPVAAVEDRAAAARAADVIVTATPATAPLLEADWLSPGCHVTAMGSDQEHKAELAPACLARADLYVPDRRAQTAALGELRAAIAAGVVAADAAFPELGEIVAGAVPGRAPGRAGAAAVTICDLTGTGVQDTAIANEARARADAQGLGVRFEA